MARNVVRLELHDNAKNSHKYYTFQYFSNGNVEVTWGRCAGFGKASSVGGTRTLGLDESDKLLVAKMKKGYIHAH